MLIKKINIKGMMAPYTVVPIIRNSAGLFRSLYFLMHDRQKWCTEISERIITFAAENWNEFSVFFLWRERWLLYKFGIAYTQNTSTFSLCWTLRISNKKLYTIQKFGTENCTIKIVRLNRRVNSGNFYVYFWNQK